MNTSIATIPRKVSGGEELVVVKKRDFDLFQKWQIELKDALAKVRRGREEYKKRKTVVAASPRLFR